MKKPSCVHCNHAVNDPTKVVTCKHCLSSTHWKCLVINDNERNFMFLYLYLLLNCIMGKHTYDKRCNSCGKYTLCTIRSDYNIVRKHFANMLINNIINITNLILSTYYIYDYMSKGYFYGFITSSTPTYESLKSCRLDYTMLLFYIQIVIYLDSIELKYTHWLKADYMTRKFGMFWLLHSFGNVIRKLVLPLITIHTCADPDQTKYRFIDMLLFFILCLITIKYIIMAIFTNAVCKIRNWVEFNILTTSVGSYVSTIAPEYNMKLRLRRNTAKMFKLNSF